MKRLTNLFDPPVAQELLNEQLADAQRRLVMHKIAAEEHTAWVEMLQKRIARIQADLIPPTKENQT